jgi:hypothetical protein
MGLGKTIEVITLIVSGRPQSTPDTSNISSVFLFNFYLILGVFLVYPTTIQGSSGRIVSRSKTTLIVCPLSTITNWEEQLAVHVRSGTLSVYVYHGASRCQDIKSLCNYVSSPSFSFSSHREIAGSLPFSAYGELPILSLFLLMGKLLMLFHDFLGCCHNHVQCIIERVWQRYQERFVSFF